MVDSFLGIDLGTQGLTVVLIDSRGVLLGEAFAPYFMQSGLPEGCYEQDPWDWDRALIQATQGLLERLAREHLQFQILGIGIAGQMHGEVIAGADGSPLGAARLWCDSRNEQEGHRLTELFQVKIPKRMTVARWLWTLGNQQEKGKQAAHLITPGGWLAWRLTGQWNLGIGDASGMFPVDQTSLDFDQEALQAFQKLTENQLAKPLRQLLPGIRRAGEDGGGLTAEAAARLGLSPGIVVAPSEGDQPVALVGSLVSSPGSVAISFGTSVCANSVGDRPFSGISDAVDHFCSVDGKPINMVFLRNGTTFMNALVRMFDCSLDSNPSENSDPSDGSDSSALFSRVMAEVMQAGNDCGGIIALPFMDDEPGLKINHGGQGTLVGLNEQNARVGNIVKAGLLATIFNLKSGMELLEQQGYPRHEIVLSGGLTKTPQLAQILADVLNTPVVLLPDSAEGCAWGAALLGNYRYHCHQAANPLGWTDFLNQFMTGAVRRFQPNPDTIGDYQKTYESYRKLLQARQG
jgi:sugar (pentulose or hexulose) kinase